MNSYNENLNATVLASLQSLDLEEKNLKSQLNASMFTLYHAEGATITAEEKLSSAKGDLVFKGSIKNIAVINTNISNNLVSSATQADQYLKQAITNAAIGASNVQVAANAIVRLASDIGSIFSIVNAADFDTDIYHQADNVNKLMNNTAYEVEVASQIAMDASRLTSEVSSSTVLDRAKGTNTAIKNLLKITSADFDTASVTVNADNATQATVSAVEKVAEGALEDICIDYLASKVAYYSTNDDLNLNLLATSDASNDPIDEDLSLAIDTKASALSFNVSFNLIRSPFHVAGESKKPTYPVEDYYIFVVKESKKLTFSISNAETLIISDSARQYVQYTPQQITATGFASLIPANNSLKLSGDKTKISGSIYFESEVGKDSKGIGYGLHDSDDDDITVGVDYVVFVMATYYTEYKKSLNNFDDFLSAPSKSFCMKNELQKVDNKNISVDQITKDNKNEKLEGLFTDELGKSTQFESQTSDSADLTQQPAYSMQLNFNVDELPAYTDKIEYRCIFLPEPGDVAKGLLTKSSLKSLIDIEYLGLQSVEAGYDLQISTSEKDINKIELAQQQTTVEYNALNTQIAEFQTQHTNPDADQKKDLTAMKASQKNLISTLEKHTTNHANEVTKLGKLKALQANALHKMVAQRHSIPGFFFNLPLAEQVSAGNYLPAIKYEVTTDTEVKKLGAAAPADNTAKFENTTWTAFIGPDATDNFGNLLVAERKYIPVIVSIAAVSEDKLDAYANAISDFEHMAAFKYVK